MIINKHISITMNRINRIFKLFFVIFVNTASVIPGLTRNLFTNTVIPGLTRNINHQR